MSDMSDKSAIIEASMNELAGALQLTRGDVEDCLLSQENEFYDIEYYLRTELHWYKQSNKAIGNLIERWMPARVSNCADIGCGVGLYANKLSAVLGGGIYLGVDLSASGLKLARRLARTRVTRKFMCANALSLPFANESVDVVFCSEVIEHLKQPDALLEEIYRVLRPGGKLILTTTTFQYYITHVLVIWGYRDILKGRSLRRFIGRLWSYSLGYRSPADRGRFMEVGLERLDHLQAFMLTDLKRIVAGARLEMVDYIYFNVKDVFPGLFFSPVNRLLRFLFGYSKIYGPNIALLCSKP